MIRDYTNADAMLFRDKVTSVATKYIFGRNLMFCMVQELADSKSPDAGCYAELVDSLLLVNENVYTTFTEFKFRTITQAISFMNKATNMKCAQVLNKKEILDAMASIAANTR